MNRSRIQDIKIDPEARRRPRRTLWLIFVGVGLMTGFAVFRMWPRSSDNVRVVGARGEAPAAVSAPAPEASTAGSSGGTTAAAREPARGEGSRIPSPASSVEPAESAEVVLTVSGYIINRERIELSPRFMGTVKWLGVKKGDSVTNGQVVVLLDDAEYRARLAEIEGRLANAQVAVRKARIDLQRAEELVASQVEMHRPAMTPDCNWSRRWPRWPRLKVRRT